MSASRDSDAAWRWRQAGGWRGQTLDAVHRRLAQWLRESGCATPDLDARLLLQEVCGLSHAAFIAEGRAQRLTAAQAERLAEMAQRRATGEPISRIVGRRDFFGRTFVITPDVLDPRPETELLVETALKLRPHVEALHSGPPLLCDAGTGSGCIVVSLLAEWPEARALALDISSAALAVARRNARRHGVGERLLCVRSDWLRAIGGPLDMLLANPPYLDAADMQALQREVRHDPELALAAGVDGLQAYRALAEHAARVLRPGGWLLVEIGAGQAAAVRALFEARGFRADAGLPAVLPDLAGIERMVALRRAGSVVAAGDANGSIGQGECSP